MALEAEALDLRLDKLLGLQDISKEMGTTKPAEPNNPTFKSFETSAAIIKVSIIGSSETSCFCLTTYDRELAGRSSIPRLRIFQMRRALKLLSKPSFGYVLFIPFRRIL